MLVLVPTPTAKQSYCWRVHGWCRSARAHPVPRWAASALLRESWRLNATCRASLLALLLYENNAPTLQAQGGWATSSFFNRHEAGCACHLPGCCTWIGHGSLSGAVATRGSAQFCRCCLIISNRTLCGQAQDC